MNNQVIEPQMSVEILTFLIASNLIQPLPSDASARRYFRIAETGRMLMKEVPGSQDLKQYLLIAEHLFRLGFSVPQVFFVDHNHNLALIEDLGVKTYTRAFAEGESVEELYALAVDTLLALHTHQQTAEVDVPNQDAPILMEELTLFSRWFAPHLKPELDVQAFEQGFLAFWQAPIEAVGSACDTLVLGDFHVDNLMLLADRLDVRACGLLDFQDAALGTPQYDLASLLQDARRDLPEGLEDVLLEQYFNGRPELDVPTFMKHFWVLAAQRHARITGLFIRLMKRDDKANYLAFMPRVLRQLKTALHEAKFVELEAFLEAELGEWWQWPPLIESTSTIGDQHV